MGKQFLMIPSITKRGLETMLEQMKGTGAMTGLAMLTVSWQSVSKSKQCRLIPPNNVGPYAPPNGYAPPNNAGGFPPNNLSFPPPISGRYPPNNAGGYPPDNASRYAPPHNASGSYPPPPPPPPNSGYGPSGGFPQNNYTCNIGGVPPNAGWSNTTPNRDYPPPTLGGPTAGNPYSTT
ncbi:unnamed protein product [Lupinus luteus]|uniref:Uncharacterized protein n=1 Tax=Lupinus luteus TaxID=3873 RepID=A0AAV1XZ81_LUPLU